MNGTGDAFSVERFGTNFICDSGEFRLAVDCPDSYRRALVENDFGFDVDGIDAFFLTHLHGDHVNGLEMVMAFSAFALSEKIELFTTPEVADDLWERRLACSLGQMWNGQSHEALSLSDFVNLHVVPWGEPTAIGPFTIETRRTIHHIPTAGFRLTDGEGVLGYACDTAFDRAYVDWLADGAHLVLHETSFGPAHTPLESLRELPRDLRERLLVVHMPDGFEEPDDLTFARQGARYSVG
jgi:ribonuclease BN (tRNA processing enzyme)